MSKKVIINIVLGIVVVGIWANSIKGIISGLNEDEPDLPQVKLTGKNPPFNDYAVMKDTAHLALNYRDPFHVGSVKTVKDTSRKPVRSLMPETRNLLKVTEDLSNIKYSGFINNPSSKKTISVLSINGKSTMVADGERAEGIKMVRNMGDSIKIIYKNKVHFIKRS
ncbi:hypothetical protein ACVW0P_002586 [Mucilaginibacter sp. UYNi724]